MKLTIANIRTTYNGKSLKCAEVTLPDGRTYTVDGERYRAGLRGNRYYRWEFHLRGPGIAHAATKNERLRGTKYDRPGGSDFMYLDSIRVSASNLTDAKRRLVALLGS
jgi:hypothetical protein